MSKLPCWGSIGIFWNYYLLGLVRIDLCRLESASKGG